MKAFAEIRCGKCHRQLEALMDECCETLAPNDNGDVAVDRLVRPSAPVEFVQFRFERTAVED